MIPKGGQYILISVCFFAFAHAAVKYLDYLPFYQLAFFRAIITAAICFTILKAKKIPIWGNNKKVLIARGVFGTIALTSYFFTLQNMPLASAVTIQYLSPLLTIFFAIYLLKEKPLPVQWLYFFMAFVGVLLVKGFDVRVTVFELVVGVFAAICSAIAYNCIRMVKDTDHHLVVVFYFPVTALVMLTPFAIKDWVNPRNEDWLIVLLMGVFTHFSQVFMTKGYQADTAANVSIYRYIGLPIAISVGYFFFSESVQYLSFLGMAVIVFAVILSANTRRLRLKQQKAK